SLEVVALIDLLLRLLEGVVDFLLVHLADDVEARHVTSPGRPGAPSAASRGPSSRRNVRPSGGPLLPSRGRCAAKVPAPPARRAPPAARAGAAARRGPPPPCRGAPGLAPPLRSCGRARRGRPASPSPPAAGGRGARSRRRRRTLRAHRDRGVRRRPHSGPPRRSRPCAAP